MRLEMETSLNDIMIFYTQPAFFSLHLRRQELSCRHLGTRVCEVTTTVNTESNSDSTVKDGRD